MGSCCGWFTHWCKQGPSLYKIRIQIKNLMICGCCFGACEIRAGNPCLGLRKDLVLYLRIWGRKSSLGLKAADLASSDVFGHAALFIEGTVSAWGARCLTPHVVRPLVLLGSSSIRTGLPNKERSADGLCSFMWASFRV